jgi:hypothetical protein
MAIPIHRALQPAIDECEDGQEEERTDSEEPCCDDLKIVEQSALDHFSATLQKAQYLAAQAEREKPRKRLKQYDGKSKRTLKRHKQCKADLAKQGYVSVFEFLAHKTQRDKERALGMVAEREQASESIPEDSELDTEESSLVFKCMGQVHCKEVLMCKH